MISVVVRRGQGAGALRYPACGRAGSAGSGCPAPTPTPGGRECIARTRAGSGPTGCGAGPRQGRPAPSAGGGNGNGHARLPDRHWRVTETTGLLAASARDLALERHFEGLAEVVGQRVGGGDDVRAGLDLDRAVAACGADEFPDRPSRAVFDPAADRQGGEHDRQVGFDGVALAVVDGLCRCSGYADVVVVMPARAGYASPEGRHSQLAGHRLLSQVRMSGSGR
jgi:hypothetical protein